MGVSPKVLKEAGCTPAAWKLLFTAPPDKKFRQIKKLELLIQNRINDGRLLNIQQYRTYAALDMAYNCPFAQTTPTIIQSLIGRQFKNNEEVLAELERWGLKPEEMFLKATIGGREMLVPNPPTFYKVLVPLVKAYVTIRWAKLFNDRNVNPLLKYEPLQPNDENRVLCEIITYMIQVNTADYGYQNTLKDVIFQMLMYATCLAFPKEVWHTEYQVEDPGGKPVLQKEGIRYDLPHPTRMFWDLHHPISSFNTDTGCEYAGYWKIVTYGSILDNADYWNRRNIGYSGRNWMDPLVSANFFQEVYPCRLQWPVRGDLTTASDREAMAAFYATNQRDMAVFETNIHMKIIPAKYKLGTYKYPIWVRFIVASDSTVIYAEPCCYSPVLYCGYDSTSLQGRNSSMALEVLPFQDIVGNTLSQIILTTKQNLANINFYDTNLLDRETIDTVRNAGENVFRSLNLVPFDSMKTNRAGLDIKQAVHQIKFPYQDVTAIFQTLNTTLAILERLLQLSAQEAGAAASHQQSKAEIELVGNATSNRVRFTGSFVDDFYDGWKRQLFTAAKAYMDDPVDAMVNADIPNVEVHLKKLGFEVVGNIESERKLVVRGKKKDLKLDALASSCKGPEPDKDAQVAQVMLQTVGMIANNQPLAEALGTRMILKLVEKASILGGADKDFQLQPDQKQEVAALQKMAEQIQIAAAKQASDEIAKPVAEQISKMQTEIEGLDKAMAALIQKLGLTPPAQPNAPNQPPTPVPAAAPVAPGTPVAP